MTNRIAKIKNVTIKRPYVFYFITAFILYLGLNSFLNKTFVTFSTLFTAYNLSFSIPFVTLHILTALLIATNINLIIFKFKELKLLSKTGGVTFLGIFGGLLAGACPGCLVGLFPAFIGLFGITATLGTLPLYGLEIQIISSILLIVAIIFLTKENVCKVQF
jgi:hypothetical protein